MFDESDFMKRVEDASSENDLEELKKLQQELFVENEKQEFKDIMGNEWFYSMLTGVQIEVLSKEPGY